MMGVYIVGTSHAHKEKPSISPEQGHNHDIAISMPKMTFGQTSEKEERHVEEMYEMNFVFSHMHDTRDRMI